tara:strand:- start:197 stop:787 length:591 start_codon:yes stop_codon:yes gene_type:complete
MLYFLTQHPEWEDILLEEIREHCEVTPGTHSILIPTVSLDTCRNMTYMVSFFLETLRLLPPVYMDSKFVVNDCVLPSGGAVKGGSRCAYVIKTINCNPEYWGEDAEKFNPRRWINEQGKVRNDISDYQYPTFNAMPRLCLGKRMAELEVVTLMTFLILNFKLTLDPAFQKPPAFAVGITISFRDGLPLRITRRDPE